MPPKFVTFRTLPDTRFYEPKEPGSNEYIRRTDIPVELLRALMDEKKKTASTPKLEEEYRGGYVDDDDDADAGGIRWETEMNQKSDTKSTAAAAVTTTPTAATAPATAAASATTTKSKQAPPSSLKQKDEFRRDAQIDPGDTHIEAYALYLLLDRTIVQRAKTETPPSGCEFISCQYDTHVSELTKALLQPERLTDTTDYLTRCKYAEGVVLIPINLTSGKSEEKYEIGRKSDGSVCIDADTGKPVQIYRSGNHHVSLIIDSRRSNRFLPGRPVGVIYYWDSFFVTSPRRQRNATTSPTLPF